MGRVISTGLNLVSTSSSARLDESLASAVRRTVELANSQEISPRERLHVKAMELFSHGNFPKACELWEDILIDHPTDMLALKFVQDAYFYMGAQLQLRDSVARVLPYWKPHMPLFSYLNGMYSFGLMECRLYDQAEKVAMEGLAMAPGDAWSVHSVAHVYEMTAQVDKGLKFMESREKDWQVSDVLASHNYWHWALCFIEKGQYEAALEIFDSQVFRRCKATGSMLEAVDASSMLYRLELEGKIRADMGIEPGVNLQHQMGRTIGVPMCQAMMEYDRGNYNRTVDLLLPIRYRLVNMGGSDAQRDVFNQLLIHAAMKSEDKHHQKLGRGLLVEREAMRPNSPMTDRLMQRALALHI
ncbi:tetratricopeptide repeat protein 38 [Notothenia coriiceps]|uniref:Tetratricopeptide repeat protein 38 n=1 Tax=Notothenia coriiceps TaxID=8208 RepID=A0A6I9N0U0_9TELE|nr:PREDICTED: tetratricopeptide repeat protein 38 [Notothenia coriiceps]